jgi:hypothetical protein
MAGDLSVQGPWAAHALRKQQQFRGYLSAAKLRIANEKNAASHVEVHVHYISDSEPSKATIDIMEKHVRDAGLPNVTIFWHKL